MKKLLIFIILIAIAIIALRLFGYTSLLFAVPALSAVLYGANGSVYVEVPHNSEQDQVGASVHYSSKGHVYVNRRGKTYEMTKKGWKYDWPSKKR